MSSPSHNFCKAAHLFVISTWYSFLTSSSFSFLRLNLYPSNSCAACLFNANLSLHLQLPYSDQYHSQLPWNFVHLVYPNAISYLSIRAQSSFESFSLERSRCTCESFGAGTAWSLQLDFDVAKFTTVTPLSLLSWCRLSFVVVGLKIFSLPTFALKSPNGNFTRYLGKWQKPAVISHKYCLLNHHFLLTWCMHIQNNDITSSNSQNYIYDNLLLTNSTLLTADIILLCTKNPVPNWWFSFPFP